MKAQSVYGLRVWARSAITHLLRHLLLCICKKLLQPRQLSLMRRTLLLEGLLLHLTLYITLACPLFCSFETVGDRSAPVSGARAVIVLPGEEGALAAEANHTVANLLHTRESPRACERCSLLTGGRPWG